MGLFIFVRKLAKDDIDKSKEILMQLNHTGTLMLMAYNTSTKILITSFDKKLTDLNDTIVEKLNIIKNKSDEIGALVINATGLIRQILDLLKDKLDYKLSSLYANLIYNLNDIIDKTNSLRNDLDNNFSPSNPNSITSISLSTRTLAASISDEVTNVHNDLNQMNSRMHPLLLEIDENTKNIKTYLSSTVIYGLPGHLECIEKTKRIAIVTYGRQYRMKSLIDASLVAGTFEQLDADSDWSYTLNRYDALLFDFYAEHFDNARYSVEVQTNVVSFLVNGGSVLFTLDVIDDDPGINTEWISTVYDFCGIRYSEHTSLAEVTQVNKNPAKACHPIFSKPYDLTSKDKFTIASSRHSLSIVDNTGEMLLGYNGFADHFLVTKESGPKSSRCAYFGSSRSWPIAPDEAVLLNNIVYWLLKYD